MAEITQTNVLFGQTGTNLAYTAATGADYALLDNADGRLTLFVNNTGTVAATVTVKAGDGSLSSLGDVIVTVDAAQTAAIPFTRLESARVKVLTGGDKGKVFVNSAVASGGTIGSVRLALLSVE